MLRIQLRRDTSDRWGQINPVLALGEPGFETDTGRLKIGNGVLPWTALSYAAGGDIGSGAGLTLDDLNAHINSLTPHPAYDDGPSLTLLYENAKV